MRDFYQKFKEDISNNFPVDRTTAMDELKKQRQEQKICKGCTCTNPVYGYGAYYADIMFVGLGPHDYDKEIGIPFSTNPAKKVHGYAEYLKKHEHLSKFWFTYLSMCGDTNHNCYDRFLLELQIAKPKWIVALGAEVLIKMKQFGSPTFEGTERCVTHLIQFGQYYPVYLVVDPQKLFYSGDIYRTIAKQDLDFIIKDTKAVIEHESNT